MIAPERRVLQWDPYLNPDEGDMEFRLTYAGRLLARRATSHFDVHDLRKEFHKQLKVLWLNHPVLQEIQKHGSSVRRRLFVRVCPQNARENFKSEGFNWLPMATTANGLICKVEMLMLRTGPPGQALFDLDNRLKTVFDALRKATGPDELGAGTASGQIVPDPDEDPFYVVLEDDRLITHLSVTTDTLLEPVLNVPANEAVRLVVNVTIRPY